MEAYDRLAKLEELLIKKDCEAQLSELESLLNAKDVEQRIIQFMQRSNRAICILSASGSISSASLRQPVAYGGQMTIEVCVNIRENTEGEYSGLEHQIKQSIGGERSYGKLENHYTAGKYESGRICLSPNT